MSSTRLSFRVRLNVGGQTVPLVSELVTAGGEAQDGVKNGFLFALDRQPGDPPVTVNLGDVIKFIESNLGFGAGSLAANPAVSTTLAPAFPGAVSSSNFGAGNATLVDIESFVINSSSDKTLFSIGVDVHGSDPTQGFIRLPEQLASWLSIDSLAIAFVATHT